MSEHDQKGVSMEKAKILILMGSDSDLPLMEPGLQFLKENDIPCTVDVASAHRNPEKTVRYAKNARTDGYEVIIAMAGMAAHLPGVIAAHTTLPVIGVPASGGLQGGIDALFSIVQMPPGIPVATVGVDASKNAAIFACEILSIKDEKIADKLRKLKEDLLRQNEDKSRKLKELLAK